jgi:hypothetical protein
MALQALWAPETQFQNKNGSLLVQGQIYVQYRGRSQLAKTYRDAEGTYLNTNPLLTDNDGRVLCFADDRFSYTAIVCDFYGNELFSFDPIPCGSGSGSGSSSGSSAQHWIGINGQTQQVSRNTYTRLKLPSGLDNVDYEGDFVLGTIKGSGTEMVLKEGLYLVNTVIRFKQSSDDLTNTLSNVIIHTRDFDTPNTQEVGAVVRDEAGPDASDDIHTITLTYIRHVSKDDVGSDRIKFAVETPNTWTECYIQNLQIAKLGSSVGGGGSAEMYSAGDYISIENDTISVTGIEPESYATHDELQSATSAFITSADLPDLSDYATEQWVLDKHYITSGDIPPIPENVVTSAELSQTSGAIEQDIADLTSAISEALSDKMDKSSSGDFYPRYDNPEGYLTSVPSEYVTESEMSSYVTEHTSAFITSADIPPIPEDLVTSGELANVSAEIVGQIPSLDGYATEQYVQDYTSGFITSADLPDVSDMATKTWVNEQHYITSADVPPQIEYSAGANIDITDHVVSVTDTSLLLAGDNVSITPSGNDYIISAQVPGTSGYVTEQEMNEAIQSATSAFITSADLPDVSDMATETWVSGQGYLKNLFQAEYGVTKFSEILDAVYNKKIVYCLIPASWGYPSGRMAFLAYVNVSDPIAASNFFEFQYYRSNSTESANDSVFVYQIKPNNVWTTTERVAGNVSDWNATSGRTQILHKPNLGIYATTSEMEKYVAEETSAFITSADLPDVSDMATKTWVSEQGYLTSVPSEYVTDTELESELSGKADTSAIPDVSNFVTQEDVDAAVSGKMDASESSAFYPMATNPSGYLTSADVDMSAYIPYSAAGVDLPNSKFKIDTDGQAYKKSNTPVALEKDSSSTSSFTLIKGGFEIVEGDIITVNGIANGISQVGFTITSTDGDPQYPPTYFVTVESDESGNHASWTVNSTYDGKTVSKIDVRASNYYDYIGTNTSATIQYVNGLKYVTEDVLSDGLSTKMEASQSSAFYPRSSNPNNYVTRSQANSTYIPYSAAGVDLPNSNFRIDTSGQAYKIGTITQDVSLTFYGKSFEPQETLAAGTYEVTTSLAGADTIYCNNPDIWAVIVNGVAKFTLDSSYPSGTVLIQIWDEYGEPMTGANASNTTLVKNDQELTEYALESYVDSAVSGKQDTLTFGYDSSDKINAINGSAIAGGGGGGGGSYTAGEFIDITNDVISVNSGDVSNLIPGSGILITQSSAGTTVSIDPEEMPRGYNETVLWSGEVSGGQTAELSEDYSAFSEIKFKYRDWNPTDGASNHTERFDTDATKFVTICGWVSDASTTRAIFIGNYSATDANHIKLTSAVFTNGGTTWSNGTGGYRLLQIVGINRKES